MFSVVAPFFGMSFFGASFFSGSFLLASALPVSGFIVPDLIASVFSGASAVALGVPTPMPGVALASGADAGMFASFASVLVRPDGYLAHLRPAADARGTEKAAA